MNNWPNFRYFKSVYKNAITIFALSLAIFYTCQPVERPVTGTVKEVMDEVVTRLYDELSSDALNVIDEKFILDYLMEEEKQILATRYWVFEVNVPVTVSLMRHDEQKNLPFWLEGSGFRNTDMTVKNELSTYEVWQKDFKAGEIGLGINGFDKHRPVYFISVAPQILGDTLEIKVSHPKGQHIATLEEGAFTYHDWDGLTLTDVPEGLKGQALLTTIRGRAREAHLIKAFRKTPFPSSTEPDQIILTWSDNPQTTMDIQWRTNTTWTEGIVKYWEISQEKSDTLLQKANKFYMEDRLLRNDRYILRFTVKLKGLKPGTAYSYQVVDGNGVPSKSANFKTSSAEEGPFSFIWFGDVHNTDKWGKLLEKANEKHPEVAFYAIAGDLVNTGLHRDDWDKLFAYSGEVFREKPLLAVPGNHDSQDGLGAWMYKEMFSFPENGPHGLEQEFTYAFRYKNALFLMLDATKPLKTQSSWIEQQLKSTGVDWKFAMFHFPPYNAIENYSDIIAEWGSIFDKYHVDMVMGGHFHYYMRSKPMKAGEIVASPTDGTIYVISIGTSGKNENAAKGNYTEVQKAASFLYQHMEIDGKTLQYSSYDFDGKIVDTFELSKEN